MTHHGKRVKTEISQLFCPTGRNVDSEEILICQDCKVKPDCKPCHPDCGVKKLKEARKRNLNEKA